MAIYYSLMIALGSSTVWMGRNLTLYDFWFYIITFSRYPMEIYTGPWGRAVAVAVHVRDSRADGGERAGADARLAAGEQQLAAGRLRDSGDRRLPGRLALGVSEGPGQLSQRAVAEIWSAGIYSRFGFAKERLLLLSLVDKALLGCENTVIFFRSSVAERLFGDKFNCSSSSRRIA